MAFKKDTIGNTTFPFPAYIDCLPFEEKLPDYTPEEELEAVLAKDEVMNIMGLRNYYFAALDFKGILENLWVREEAHRKTASLGANWGFYQGFEEIRRFAEHISAAGLAAASQPVNTPMIYVAFDRKTARGLWYTDGYFTDGAGNTDVVYQKVAADFIREGDEWKIWHLVLGADVDDQLYTGPAPDEPEMEPLRRLFGTPTTACITHDFRYNWNDDYPAEPVPYETFSLRESFAPEGCPRYRKHMREVKKHAKE